MTKPAPTPGVGLAATPLGDLAVEGAGGEVFASSAGEQEPLRAVCSVKIDVLPNCVDDVRRDRDVADASLTLGSLGDHAGGARAYDATPYADDAVWQIDVRSAELGDLTEAEGAAVCEQHHQPVSLRNGRHDGGNLLGSRWPDPSLGARRTAA